MDLFEAIQKRKSARAFLDKMVSRKEIREIIAFAGMAPSAINLQPWEYLVTYGEEKERLVRRLLKARTERQVSCGPGTAKPLPRHFTERSRSSVRIMQPFIDKTGKSFNQFIEEGSCRFYGAPVAIIVTLDQVFPKIRYLDVGLSVAYLLLAAQAKGLATCPVGLITAYGDEIADVLNIPEDKEILLAIALGYPDEGSPINCYKTQREPLDHIRSWYE